MRLIFFLLSVLLFGESRTQTLDTHFCDNKPDGDYQNPDNLCGKSFYKCSSQVTYVVDCPENLAFNPDTDRCEYQATVPGCGGSSSLPTSTVPHPPTTASIKTTTSHIKTTRTTARKTTTTALPTSEPSCEFDRPCTSADCCPKGSQCMYFSFWSDSFCQQPCSKNSECENGIANDYCRDSGYSGAMCCMSTFFCADHPGKNFCICK